MNVYLGQTVAAATWPPPWRALSKQRPELDKALKVMWQTRPLINNGLVVFKEVPEKLVHQVHDLLVTLHTHERGRKILKLMELSRFETANDKSYAGVREFLERFNRSVRALNETG
jgi:phosphonate transport system substrate-binding protein